MPVARALATAAAGTGAGGPWLAIVNPAAGALTRPGHAASLAAALTRDLGMDVAFSEAPGQAEALARAAAGYVGLLAVGGDGTVAQVVNGMDHRRQSLAVLPAGTGNGLARDLGLPLPGRGCGPDALGPALAAARAALRRPRPRPIDLIDVRYCRPGEAAWTRRLAVSTTAVGYAAEVVALAKGALMPLARRLPAGLCYPLGAGLQALRQRPFRIRIGLDGAPPAERRATNLMVHSTAHAGNFRAFPLARPDDGRLTVLLADAGPLAQLRHNLAVLRRRYDFATAEAQAAGQVAIDCDRPLRLMADGELVDGVVAVAWRVLAGQVQVFASPGSP